MKKCYTLKFRSSIKERIDNSYCTKFAFCIQRKEMLEKENTCCYDYSANNSISKTQPTQSECCIIESRYRGLMLCKGKITTGSY